MMWLNPSVCICLSTQAGRPLISSDLMRDTDRHHPPATTHHSISLLLHPALVDVDEIRAEDGRIKCWNNGGGKILLWK